MLHVAIPGRYGGYSPAIGLPWSEGEWQTHSGPVDVARIRVELLRGVAKSVCLVAQ
jgi:hypothetical protein